MYHHDSRDYETAKSEAATKAKEKMGEVFQRGTREAEKVLNDLQSIKINDHIARPREFKFGIEGKAIKMMMGLELAFMIHQHAMNQLGAKAGVPKKYIDNLMTRDEEWSHDLVAHTLNEIYDHSPKRWLVREVDGQVRAFLSDKFKRRDSRPIVGACVEEASKYGAIPVESRILPTKFFMKMLLPLIFEPIPNDPVCFGLKFQNSDFGHGKTILSLFAFRCWCTNLAMMEDMFSQVHLGAKLPDELELSRETYALDAKTTVSAMTDIIGSAFSPDSVHERVEMIRTAATEEMDVGKAMEQLRNKSKVTKGEADEITKVYNTPDVELLPPGNTAWRFSNAISAFAKNTDAYRALELETLAGEVAGLHKEKK